MKTASLICGLLLCLFVNGQSIATGESATPGTSNSQSQGSEKNTPVLSSSGAKSADSIAIPANEAPELKPKSVAVPNKKVKSPKKK